MSVTIQLTSWGRSVSMRSFFRLNGSRREKTIMARMIASSMHPISMSSSSRLLAMARHSAIVRPRLGSGHSGVRDSVNAFLFSRPV